MSQATEHACAHCRYYTLVDALTGNCHRFPPVFAGASSPRETHHWRFPAVSVHGWCGEFLPPPAAQMSSSGATI